MHHTLSTYALEKRDKLFVNSMLELTQKKLGINWVLNDSEGQVTLVDIDQPTGIRFWQAYHTEKKLIAFANHNHVRAELFLEKPLRVQPFTELLKKLSETLEEITHINTVDTIKTASSLVKPPVEPPKNIPSRKPNADSNANHYDPMQYLSGLLQASLLTKEVIVLDFSGFASVYVLPEEKRCYTSKMMLAQLNPSQHMFFSARAEQFNRHVLNIEQAHHYITEKCFTPYDIYTFMWGSTLLSSQGRLLNTHSMQTFVRLKQWPNFTALPHEPIHMKLAAFMLKNTANIPRIANATKMPMGKVVDFFNACAMSNLLLVQKSTAAQSTNTTPEKKISTEKRGLLRNILRRLGRSHS